MLRGSIPAAGTIMKIAILGFGREGKSLLKFLKKSNPRTTIKILDQKIDKPPHQTRMGAFGTQKNKSLLWCGGKNYLKNLRDFDIVYRSPGVPYNLPEIQKAIKNKIKFSSATKLFFEKAKGKIIGITGTKGKGTTATLLYKILKTCGKNIYLAGNIGKSALEILPRLKKNSLAILELSSFQLQDMKVSPHIAIILDIFPDHLDLHKNLKEYFEAKTNIAKWQKKTDKIFYFGDNKHSKWLASKSRGKKYPVLAENFKLFGQKDLKIAGEHNFKNAIMATSIALSLGCPKNKILKVVKNFRGNEHRLELARTIRINQQNQHRSAFIKFYNDSASTNPQTAAAAIRAFKQPKILISGGKDKGLNYSPLANALKGSNTKLVILFGENKKKIAKAIKNSGIPIKSVKDLKSSVNLAYKEAKEINSVVIFSPGAASFDMFKDYADRGKKFKELVKRLK